MQFTMSSPSYKNTNEMPIQNTECPVCLESLNNDEFIVCGECKHTCCNKCVYRLLSFCPDVKQLLFHCPLCRTITSLAKLRDLKRDRKGTNGLLKHLLALGSDGKTEHTFTNKCCLEFDFNLVLEHKPCPHGCIQCYDSIISVISTQVNNDQVKSVTDGWEFC